MENNLSTQPLVTHLEADSNYTHVYFKDGSRKLVSKTLKSVVELFPTLDFIRCHAKYAVNRNQITDIKKSKDNIYKLVIANGKVIPISRRKKSIVLGDASCLVYLKRDFILT